MTGSTFNFDFNDLHLSVSLIENVIGYKEDDDKGLVTDLIEEILGEAKEMCSIKAQYSIFSPVGFNNDSKSIVLNGISFDVKKIVFGQIRKSESIAIFLCTAGEEIGVRSRKAMHDRDLLKGYIYDIVGSEIVEATADLMQNDLENKMIYAGMKITNRYSPGYCGWDVAEQHKLFQLLPDNFCGIRLTQSALMDPVKSVSGFIGIGQDVRHNPYTCSICDMKDCIYRKKKTKT